MKFASWMQYVMTAMNVRSTRRRVRERSRNRTWLAAEVLVLEDRVLLDASTNLVAYGGGVPATTASPTGFTPTQVRHAYGFDSISFNGTAGDGTGTTIAIVDAYDDPNIASDLHQFDLAYGLSDPTFIKVNQNGSTSSLPAANAGWITEIALDVEWAHAIAPGATILLVEANSASDGDLFTAVNTARNYSGVNVVSMSWGAGEWSTEAADHDATLTTPVGHQGVTFVASSGDTGAPVSYPSISPNVLSVGGTSLSVGSGGAWSSETGWSGSGGGISAYETQPVYQKGIVTQSTSLRTNPDVAYNADPGAGSGAGFGVYDSYNNGTTNPWGQWGGTSAGAPQWAALIAIADQGRALSGQASLDGPTQTLPTLYALPAADFHDMTSGTSTGSPNYSAGTGYDLVTGLGTPHADLVVHDLVAPGTTLDLSGSWTAYNSSGTVQGLGKISQTGESLALTNYNSATTTATYTALNQVTAASLNGTSNLVGTFDTSAADLGRINWSDGTFWLRNTLYGEYSVSTGTGVLTLASISQSANSSGPVLTLINGSTQTTATFSTATTVSLSGGTTATFADGQITFASTGTFANQVWTKLDLPTNFKNLSGDPVRAVQNNGSSIAFFDKYGNATLGTWLGPTRISAYGQVATLGSGSTAGELIYADGSVWSENLGLNGNVIGSGAATITAAPATVIVTAYTNVSGTTVYTIQTGSNGLAFIDGANSISTGVFIDATHAYSTQYSSSDVARFSGNQILWQDGGVWTKTTSPSYTVTVTDYTNAGGVPVHVVVPNNGTASLVFVDGHGVVSTGTFTDSTHAYSNLYGSSDVATFGTSSITWTDGGVWTKQAFAPKPSNVLATAYTNGAGTTVYLVQTGNNSVLFIDGNQVLHLGTFSSATQVSTPDWSGNPATFSGNRLLWSDGSIWTETSSPSYTVTVTDYVNASGVAVHTIVPNNGSNKLAFVDGAARLSTGVFTDSTHAYSDYYGSSDVATFGTNTITWTDGGVWTKTTSLPLMITFTDASGHVSHLGITGSTTLVGLDGLMAGYTGTLQNGKITWTKSGFSNIVWDDFDFNALNALFEMANGYP